MSGLQVQVFLFRRVVRWMGRRQAGFVSTGLGTGLTAVQVSQRWPQALQSSVLPVG